MPRHPLPQQVASRLADRIRTLRVAAAMTQERLAERAEVKVQTISRIETGRMEPSIGMLWRLAAALGCGLADLFDEDAETVESDGEDSLLAMWRAMSQEEKVALLRIFRAIQRGGFGE